MNNYIGYCGLDCEACEARIATVNDDDSMRTEVAKKWSALNGVTITPEMINCSGCRIPGPKTPFCDKICDIRQCAMAKECETCGSCAEMMTCGKLGAIIKNNEEALHNLKK